MISAFMLPFSFDPKCLLSDLEKIETDEWFAHLIKAITMASGAELPCVRRMALPDNSMPTLTPKKPFVDTPIMMRCPYVRTALTSFECPLRAVRFLKLSPGSTIKEHEDFTLGVDNGQLRFHVPVCTNAGVDFFLDGNQLEMKEGECWYLDLSRPHSVRNRGTTDRVHLVIDCEVNEWLRRMVPIGAES